jgi:glycosyltransferase involved in cell wall biosynthesis
MKISVITPSYKQPAWLRRAVASVADQTGVEIEHIVQDACSGAGVAEACRPYAHVRLFQEPDGGMYDAINKGWGRASGDILCWLNCDEQYLPGALARVAQEFAAHPDIDIIFGDVLLIRPDGSLIAFRKAMPLRWPYVLSAHLYASSCALFFRRRFFDAGLRFDTRWRAAGDAELVVRLLRAGYRARHVGTYLACFTQTGANLGATTHAEQEHRQLIGSSPRWIRWGRPLWCGLRYAEKIVHGCYHQGGRLDYAVFAGEGARERRQFSVDHASYQWREG